MEEMGAVVKNEMNEEKELKQFYYGAFKVALVLFLISIPLSYLIWQNSKAYNYTTLEIFWSIACFTMLPAFIASILSLAYSFDKYDGLLMLPSLVLFLLVGTLLVITMDMNSKAYEVFNVNEYSTAYIVNNNSDRVDLENDKLIAVGGILNDCSLSFPKRTNNILNKGYKETGVYKLCVDGIDYDFHFYADEEGYESCYVFSRNTWFRCKAGSIGRGHNGAWLFRDYVEML